MASKVVQASLEGYNGTIFVYGQTGSGKTYTMMGPAGCDLNPRPASNSQQTGLILLSLQDLFNCSQKYPQKHYFFTCSYLQIYNEQVFDLLGYDEFKPEVLSVNEDPNKGFYVKGLSEHVVSDMQEVLKYIQRGETNRKYAATAMNHHSSRSHTIFRLFVTSMTVLEDSEEEEGNITTESVLNFVDLSGSERVQNLQDTVIEPRRRSRSKTAQSMETLLTEGKHINTSLFYLCQVINKLSEKNTSKSDTHIPYRNSNLTKILRSSLGGNSLTSIICTATPSVSQFEMTLSTLRFGGTAKTITNKVAANIRSNKNAELLSKYQKDIQALKKELELAQQGGKTRAEQSALTKRHLEERIQRLTHMLFNQSRQDHISRKQKPIEGKTDFWSSKAGDLIVDQKLAKLPQNLTKFQLKFDQNGLFALQKMRTLHRETQIQQQVIQDLRQSKTSLVDSKNNLKNDLKKALGLCKELSVCKQKYKVRVKSLYQRMAGLESRLAVLASQEELDSLEYEQLEILEKFVFDALDTVKNAKFRKKYQQKLSEVKVEVPNSPRQFSQENSLWDKLGFEPLVEVNASDQEHQIQFETSFYRNRPNKEPSFQTRDLLFQSMIENEFSISPIKARLNSVTVPLLEISNTIPDLQQVMRNYL